MCPSCREELSWKEIEEICEACQPPGLIFKYIEFLGWDFQERNADVYFSCLSATCNAITPYDENTKVVKCKGCNTLWCTHCRLKMHVGETCAQYFDRMQDDPVIR